jgi:hypothetical protein
MRNQTFRGAQLRCVSLALNTTDGLRKSLPAHFVPQTFEAVASIPRNASGKFEAVIGAMTLPCSSRHALAVAALVTTLGSRSLAGCLSCGDKITPEEAVILVREFLAKNPRADLRAAPPNTETLR